MSYYDAIILAESGLVAYWPENESSGSTAHDSTSNHYDASLFGFTLGQPGLIANETETAIAFTGNGTLTAPPALQIWSFSALSLEWWQKFTEERKYIVVTTDGTSILFYINGALYINGSGDPVLVSQSFDFAGSYQAGVTQKTALYNKVLTSAQIQAHWLAGSIWLNTLTVKATCRDGIIQATCRDGLVKATCRDGFVVGRLH